MLFFDLDYKKRTFVRWINWESFIESIQSFNHKNQNKIVLFFLTYNFLDSATKLLDILNSDDARQKFDIIVVDNHSETEKYSSLINYIQNRNITNITVIRTRENLGGSGGNAIGLEYILSQEYEYCIFTEDDAFPTSKNFIAEMIKHTNKKTIVRTLWQECKIASNPFHFTLFPIEFLKKNGITNPSYFMRSDDEEFNFRCFKTAKKYGYTYKDLSISYSHSFIKKGSGKYWQIYFSTRNALQTKMLTFYDLNWTYYFKLLGIQLGILFGYLWLGFTKIGIESNRNYLFTILFAIKDFVLCGFTFEHNIKQMKYLSSLSLEQVLPVTSQVITINELDKFMKNLYLLDPMLLCQKIKPLRRIQPLKNIFSKGIILSGYNTPLYPLLFFARKTLLIEEFFEDKVIIGYIDNQRTFVRVIIVILSALLAFFFFIPISIIILIKIFIFQIIRWLGK